MRPGSWNLDRIDTAFAGAAVEPAHWSDVMEVVAQETGSFGCALFPIRGRSPHVPFTASLGETFEKYFNEGWVKRDERYRAVPQMERFGVGTDLDYIDPDRMKRHAYYQEFLAPFGLNWFAGVRMAAGDDFLCLSIQRSAEQGPFQSDELSKLARLSRRLGAAAALSQSLGFARVEAASNAFELSGNAVIMLDRCAEIVRINASAQRLIGNGIKIFARKIASEDSTATAALHSAIHLLLWTRTTSALMPPVVMPREGARPLLAYCTRLEGLSVDLLSPCQAMVVLIDPDRQKYPPRETLIKAFDLTPAEARLAAEIAAGRDISAIASEFGISKETARTQLRMIFAKTRVNRQAELVAVLAAAAFGHDNR